MFTIGLTGGIGSGKSTVARWFIKRRVPVLDADKTVHRLLESDSLVIEKSSLEFGPEILDNKGQIIRSKLGGLVFNNEDARKRLERIVHPRVIECMMAEQASLKNNKEEVCVWDVPLLIEAGFDKFVDEVWVVWIPRDLQILRVRERDNLSLVEIEARINAQGSLDDKRQRAHVVIDNSGNELQTMAQLEEAWKRLVAQRRFGES